VKTWGVKRKKNTNVTFHVFTFQGSVAHSTVRCRKDLAPLEHWREHGTFSSYDGVAVMLVKVNGEDRQVPSGQDVHGLLADHRLTPEKVAVELNRRLLRRESYNTQLREGDQVEIVTFVGGGD
jgi:sulfur carrier protein